MMFSLVARRLSPLCGQPAKAATTTIAMTFCHSSRRGGVSALASRPAFAPSPPERGTCTGGGVLLSAKGRRIISPCVPYYSTGTYCSVASNSSSAFPSPFSALPRLVVDNSVRGNALAPQTRGFATKKHKRVIKQSKGFRGRANRCFRIAIRRLEKSWQYAYRDRKVKKREFRKLWIQRVNAGVRQYGISYSRFVQMQARSGVVLDRKILSGLAMYEPFSFKAVVDVVQKFSVSAAGSGGE